MGPDHNVKKDYSGCRTVVLTGRRHRRNFVFILLGLFVRDCFRNLSLFDAVFVAIMATRRGFKCFQKLKLYNGSTEVQ